MITSLIASHVLVLTIYGKSAITNEVVSVPLPKEVCLQYATTRQPAVELGSYNCVDAETIKAPVSQEHFIDVTAPLVRASKGTAI